MMVTINAKSSDIHIFAGIIKLGRCPVHSNRLVDADQYSRIFLSFRFSDVSTNSSPSSSLGFSSLTSFLDHISFFLDCSIVSSISNQSSEIRWAEQDVSS